MRNRPLAILVACILALGSLGALANLTPATSARINGDVCEVRVRVNGVEQWQEQPLSFCTFPAPTPTATVTSTAIPPTATHTHTPTPTPVASGWHAPTTHEHGDAPPAWVLASNWQPFTQVRESHVGYKGVYATMPNGVQSYLVAHILATSAARTHGDHDYQLWVKDPSGGISYWSGVTDFGSPPVLRTTDTGERPIILSQGDGGCETWYGRARVFDLGWVMCGRYQNFAGDILGGTGTHRTMDWIIYPDRFAQFPGAAPTLAQYCQVQYGICRFSFAIYSRDYATPTIIPIN